MRVYEVVYDYDNKVSKTYIAARNKKELMNEWGDSNYMRWITDVTSDFDLSKHKNWQEDLECCGITDWFNIGEVRLIVKIIEDYIDKANKKKERRYEEKYDKRRD